jgi:hypothetical protein
MGMIKKDCTCTGCALWLRLEAERYDTSWKQKTFKPNREVIRVEKKVYIYKNDRRDKLMFNAGRYAAGDRDKAATKAHEELEKNG